MQMLKRFLLVVLIVGVSPAIAVEPSWQLISPEEMEKYTDIEDGGELNVRSVPDALAPEIIVQYPDSTKTIASPTDIRLVFRAADGSKVLPQTFRVKYGALGFDVTERIISRYRPTSSGLSVERAGLPAGKHLLTLTIQDDAGRVAIKRLSMSVEIRR
jgi:hypothetical protein